MDQSFANFLFGRPTPPAMPKQDEKDQEASSLKEDEEASRRLTIAKRNFTRAENLLRKQLKEDPRVPAEILKGQDLLESLHKRFQELNLRFDTFELFFDHDQDQEHDREDLQMRFSHLKSQFGLWAEDPAAPAQPMNSNASMLPIMGMNFNVRKIMPDKFSGEDLRRYPEFRIQFDLVAQSMTQMGFRDAQKLLELKKCLDGIALDTIKQLPLEDGNFKNALKLLDVTFRRPIKFAELVVLDLLQAPKMGNDKRSITATLNTIEQAEQALEGLRLSKAQAGELLFNVICESKLNKSIVREWTRMKDKKKDDNLPCGHSASLEDLKSIIRQQRELEEVFEERRVFDGMSAEEGRKKREERTRGTVQGSFTSLQKGKKEQKCLICDKTGHRAVDCYSFTKAKTVQDRFKVVNNTKLCTNCVRGMHSVSECRQTPQCSKCNKRHHTLLHTEQRQANAGNSKNSQISQEQTQQSTSQVVNAAMKSGQKSALLQTCVAWAMSPSGEKFMARVFLDSGSELTMIRRDLAKRMGLNGPAFDLSLTGIGGVNVPPSKERLVSLKLMSRKGDYVSPELKAVTKTELTGRLRKADIDLKAFSHLKDIEFTEEFPREEVTVDILIGVADFGILTDGEVIRGNPGEPVAMATKLGYVLCGPA